MLQKMVNYIMARALHFRQFQTVLGKVKAQYNTLLTYITMCGG